VGKKLGWKDHTKVKDISSLLVLYEIYLIFIKDQSIFFHSINIYSLKPSNFGF